MCISISCKMKFVTKLLTTAAASGGTLFLLFNSSTDGKVDVGSNKRVFAASVENVNGKWDSDWDRRSQGERSKATRNIILIRHGQYNLNGDCDEKKYLTDLGREQAILTGMRMKEKGLDKKISRFVISTMTRACETGDLIYKELGNPEIPIERTDLLREGVPIEPDPPTLQCNPGPKDFFLDGARIENAFRQYIHRADPGQEADSVEVFVCHANVIRYFVCRALQLPPNAWLRMSIRHGSVTNFSIRPDGRVSLKELGDTGFMPPDKLSFQ